MKIIEGVIAVIIVFIIFLSFAILFVTIRSVFSDLVDDGFLSSFLSGRSKESFDSAAGSFAISGIGTNWGDSISGEELYLEKYDHMMEGIDPEMQASQDEYAREQDEVIVSRGAAGPYATETDHYKPPNTPWGLTGFRQNFHDTYALPDARQVPSDDPNQFYSSNPSGYLIGAAM